MDKEYTFNGQRADEKVLYIVNSHPYVMYLPTLELAVLLALSVAIVLFFPTWYLIAIGVLLLAAVLFARALYAYRESILIITDQRLFVVTQRGFFNRQISEVDLFKILDMTTETKGFAKTLLKYGDLIVRTAGAREGGDLIIRDIPEPYSIQQKIANLNVALKN